MASVVKRPNSKYWHAVFRIPQEDGQSRVVFRSTKKTSKREATQVAVDIERAARAEAEADSETGRRILSVITRATEHATRGTLTAKKGRNFIREVVKIATGQDVRAFTVKEWIDDWIANQSGLSVKSQRAYKTATNNFLSFLGDRQNLSIEGITSEDIRDFRQWLLDGTGNGKKVSNTTAQNKTKCIKSIFAEALSLGIIDLNPAAGLKPLDTEPVLTRKPFTADEVNLLILHAENDEWRRFITLAAFTGLRMGDCMKMEWDCIDLDGGVIEHIPAKTKRKKIKVVIPIHPTLDASLREIPKSQREKGFVFPRISKMNTSGNLGMSVKFTELMNKAGVSRGKSQTNAERTNHERSFHSLRHTFTSWLANANVPAEFRMKITGHKTRDIHDLYTHLDHKLLVNAMNSLPTLTESKNEQP